MSETVSCEDMKLINRYSRRELSAEEVYVFPVILCDNERDRDGERFSISALKRLAELFVGKTGIFDHDPKGANQTARIYSAETVSEPERKTVAGEVYTYVKAWAYLMKSDKNADFIRDIDGGIKKEVSVSCSVKRRVCSICGSDKNAAPCSHVKGGYYGGKVCEVILDEPTDAYEWSFVAIPAQPNAGITKSLSEIKSEKAAVSALTKQLDECRGEIEKAAQDITAEIVRLGQFCVPAYQPQTVKAMCEGMDIGQLICFKEQTRKLAASGRAEKSVLSGGEQAKTQRNGTFKLKG